MDTVKYLDELVADFITETKRSITDVTLLEFMGWASTQASKSTASSEPTLTP